MAGQRDTPSAPGHKLLRDHRQQRQRHLLADLRLVGGGERIENARHGLHGVVGVQRGKHQVAGFGGGQHGGHGFGVAHFAHQDHVRRLAHDAAQGAGEIGRVAAHLDLLDHRGCGWRAGIRRDLRWSPRAPRGGC